jgi:hypothetical protein
MKDEGGEGILGWLGVELANFGKMNSFEFSR